jgi:hypothetical protein
MRKIYICMNFVFVSRVEEKGRERVRGESLFSK